jgi:hypothetical protein
MKSSVCVTQRRNDAGKPRLEYNRCALAALREFISNCYIIKMKRYFN